MLIFEVIFTEGARKRVRSKRADTHKILVRNLFTYQAKLWQSNIHSSSAYPPNNIDLHKDLVQAHVVFRKP